jgi:hypothetical protein
MSSDPEVANAFAAAGYAVLRGAFPAPLRARVESDAQPLVVRAQLANAGEPSLETDGVAEGSYGWYGRPAFDALLEFFRPRVERAVGAPLAPTYSYIRCYVAGSRLSPHRDRHACEISVTLPIVAAAPLSWPIFVAPDLPAADPVRVELSPGDALAYRGCELAHWREPLAQAWSLHLFLHYVRRDGPHASWKFDRRAALGDPPHPDSVGELAG